MTIDLAILVGVTGGTAPRSGPIRAKNQAQVDRQIAYCQGIHGKPTFQNGVWVQPEKASYDQCLAGGERFQTDRD